MSSANSESFTSFPIWIPFISFSALIAVGHCKISTKGEVHSNTGIPQETRKESNK